MATIVDGRVLYHSLDTFGCVGFNFVPYIHLFTDLQIDHKHLEGRNDIFCNHR